jgi:hypothetical protein
MSNGLHSILDLNNKLTKINSSKGKITLKNQHSQPTAHTRQKSQREWPREGKLAEQRNQS